jgi:hypothetical protein
MYIRAYGLRVQPQAPLCNPAMQAGDVSQVKAEHRAEDARLLPSGPVDAAKLHGRNGFAFKLDLGRAKVVGHHSSNATEPKRTRHKWPVQVLRALVATV